MIFSFNNSSSARWQCRPPRLCISTVCLLCTKIQHTCNTQNNIQHHLCRHRN